MRDLPQARAFLLVQRMRQQAGGPARRRHPCRSAALRKPRRDPPAIIGGTTQAGTLNYGESITLTFVKPGDAGTSATTDSIKILGDWYPLGSGSVQMIAYDINGAALASVTATDAGPLGTGPVLELNLAGIHRVTFGGTSGTVGFDNVEFGQLSYTSIPEPASLTLLFAGLGAIGIRTRRRH